MLHGSTHMFTGTMLMRVSRNQQLKRTTSKQMNKTDRAYLMDAGITSPIKCLWKEQRVLTHSTTWMTLKNSMKVRMPDPGHQHCTNI